MPFYTYKCNTCGLEKDFLKSMNDLDFQLCPKCCYDPNINGDDETILSKTNWKAKDVTITEIKHGEE